MLFAKLDYVTKRRRSSGCSLEQNLSYSDDWPSFLWKPFSIERPSQKQFFWIKRKKTDSERTKTKRVWKAEIDAKKNDEHGNRQKINRKVVFVCFPKLFFVFFITKPFHWSQVLLLVAWVLFKTWEVNCQNFLFFFTQRPKSTKETKKEKKRGLFLSFRCWTADKKQIKLYFFSNITTKIIFEDKQKLTAIKKTFLGAFCSLASTHICTAVQKKNFCFQSYSFKNMLFD